jgi:hypothetical protein
MPNHAPLRVFSFWIYLFSAFGGCEYIRKLPSNWKRFFNRAFDDVIAVVRICLHLGCKERKKKKRKNAENSIFIVHISMTQQLRDYYINSLFIGYLYFLTLVFNISPFSLPHLPGWTSRTGPDSKEVRHSCSGSLLRRNTARRQSTAVWLAAVVTTLVITPAIPISIHGWWLSTETKEGLVSSWPETIPSSFKPFVKVAQILILIIPRPLLQVFPWRRCYQWRIFLYLRLSFIYLF